MFRRTSIPSWGLLAGLAGACLFACGEPGGGVTISTGGEPTGASSETTSPSETDPATGSGPGTTGEGSDTGDSEAATDATTSTTGDPTGSDPSAPSTSEPSTTTGDPSDGVTTEFVPEPCQVEMSIAQPTPSNVLFVLDKSGSMSMEKWDHDANAQTEPETRWKSLYSVVEFVVTAFDDTIHFGAKLFPKYDAGSFINEGACIVDPGVEVPIAPMNAAAVLAGIPGPEYAVLGGTPVFTGLGEAIGYVQAAVDPAESRALILVADGEISCSESSLEAFNLIHQAWSNEGIATYVVGIDAQGNATEQLNLYAEAGGKPNQDGGEILFYQTVNQNELHAAIQAIVFDTISCVIKVDPVPEFPELFEVWIDGQMVAQVDDCGAEDGWVWAAPDHSVIELCGSPCISFKEAGELEARYYCVPE